MERSFCGLPLDAIIVATFAWPAVFAQAQVVGVSQLPPYQAPADVGRKWSVPSAQSVNPWMAIPNANSVQTNFDLPTAFSHGRADAGVHNAAVGSASRGVHYTSPGDAFGATGGSAVNIDPALPVNTDPEHQQLLKLSNELMQQARFVEAKAALAASAQLSGGGQVVLAYAEYLRWRMGLRRLNAAELDEWLGWKHGLAEPAEPEWAEVPSSLPKKPKASRSQAHQGSNWSSLYLIWTMILGMLPILALVVFAARRTHARASPQPLDEVQPAGGTTVQDVPQPPQPQNPDSDACAAQLSYPPPDPALFLSDESDSHEEGQDEIVGGFVSSAGVDIGGSSSSEGSPAPREVAPPDFNADYGSGFEPGTALHGHADLADIGESSPSSSQHTEVKTEEGNHIYQGGEERSGTLRISYELPRHELEHGQEFGEHLTAVSAVNMRHTSKEHVQSNVDCSTQDFGRDSVEHSNIADQQITACAIVSQNDIRGARGDGDDGGGSSWEQEDGFDVKDNQEAPFSYGVPLVADDDADDEWEDVRDKVREDGEEEEEEEEVDDQEEVAALGKNDEEREYSDGVVASTATDPKHERVAYQLEVARTEDSRSAIGNLNVLAAKPDTESNDGATSDSVTVKDGTAQPVAVVSESMQSHMVQIGGVTVSLHDLCHELGVRGVEPDALGILASGFCRGSVEEASKGFEDKDVGKHNVNIKDTEGKGADESSGEVVTVKGAVPDTDHMDEQSKDVPDWCQVGVASSVATHQIPTASCAQMTSSTAGDYIGDHHAVYTENEVVAVVPTNSGVQIYDDGDEDDWGWGHAIGRTPAEERAFAEEQRQESEAVASLWTPEPKAWHEAFPQDERSRPLHLEPPVANVFRGGEVPDGAFVATGALAKGDESGFWEEEVDGGDGDGEGADEAAGPPVGDDKDAGDIREKHGGLIYFGRPPPSALASTRGKQGSLATTGRTWYKPGTNRPATSEKPSDKGFSAGHVGRGAGEDDGFVLARPTRFRPNGCYVRLQGSGPEVFLPIEHVEPRTEGYTSALRDRITQAGGRVYVRSYGDGVVTMLSRQDAEKRSQELQARRVLMDEGIASLRDNFNSKNWISAKVSAVQNSGAYVGIVEGKDAFVPVGEMPKACVTQEDVAADEAGGKGRPGLTVGQKVEVRVVRYSWQSDSFLASMLPYEESVARRRVARGYETEGARSAPPAARSASVPAARSTSVGRDRKQMQDSSSPEGQKALSKNLERWAAKGFSVLSNDAARELNDYLRQNTEEKKGKTTKTGPAKNERKYIVSFARGMNAKVIGQITLPTKASEKEVKDAAIALVYKEGELKAGQDHKGATIAKNIVTVKA